jgi:hypothetical protein
MYQESIVCLVQAVEQIFCVLKVEGLSAAQTPNPTNYKPVERISRLHILITQFLKETAIDSCIKPMKFAHAVEVISIVMIGLRNYGAKLDETSYLGA